MIINTICSYTKGVKQTQKESKNIKDIIEEVKSQKHQNLVKEIQNQTSLNNDSEVKELKTFLPAFYPTIECYQSLKPTGIIQFDIDIKDNPEVDMDELERKLKEFSYTVYLFKSPRAGLKFGINTDLHKLESNDTSEIKKRFKVAYDFVLETLHDTDEIPTFNADKAVSSINQACYLSSDKNAYFNEFAAIMPVFELVMSHEGEVKEDNSIKVLDENLNPEFVEELLEFIPKSLSYQERLPINMSVCHLLGINIGKKVLTKHWNKDAKKLEEQIDSQMQSFKNSNIGVLINAAKKYGYREITGRARNSLSAKESSIKLPELVSIEDATIKLEEIVNDFFFGSKLNTYVSITVGAGKTRTIIEALADKSMHGINVLYLVRDHNLGEQVEKKLNEEIERIKALDNLPWYSKRRNSVIRIKGKDRKISEATELNKDSFGMVDANGEMTESCDYTDQYESHSHIRIMTHNEYFNLASKWSSGVEYVVESTIMLPNGELHDNCYIKPSTKSNYWKPDFIIIDEDILTLDKDKHVRNENLSCKYKSIVQVINDLKSGIDLLKAIEINKHQILIDDKFNFQNFSSKDGYKENEKYSEILNCFALFLSKKDSHYLDGIYYINDSLRINRLKKAQKRYEKVPTLILDATANEQVVKRTYPNFKFEKISIKSNDNVNIYQLCNKNITKSFLEENHNREVVIKGLCNLIENYENVGLITYKSLKNDENFISNIAESLGIKIYAHFGKLRGSNDFENVDCLLVVGRFSFNENENQKFTEAVFGIHNLSNNRYYADKNVRMKDGRVFKISNLIYENESLQSTYEHKSVSETIQAIGRGRIVHGKEKDIFLFSCESLGTDIEITDFFRFEEFFEESIFGKVGEDRIKNIESIDIRNKELAKLLIEIFPNFDGNMNNYVKNNKIEILEELKSIGFVNDPSKTKTLINSSFKNTEAVH